jgi:DNA-directed RNA polymerase specialized sigma24 family protein
VSEQGEFRELWARVRVGDEEAAAELVRRYGPVIRSVIRVRLRGSRLRRYFDSMDVYQSVLCKFFVRAAEGHFELDGPQQLIRLFTTMSKNAFIDRLRREQAGIGKLTTAGDDALLWESDPRADTRPGEALARKDLVERISRMLSESVLELAGPWSEGRSWPEIGEARGEAPDALRMKFSRALKRVRGELARDDSSVSGGPDRPRPRPGRTEGVV